MVRVGEGPAAAAAAAAHGRGGLETDGRPGGNHLVVEVLLHSAVLLLLLLLPWLVLVVARRADGGRGPVLRRGEAHGNAGTGHKRRGGQRIYFLILGRERWRYWSGAFLGAKLASSHDKLRASKIS